MSALSKKESSQPKGTGSLLAYHEGTLCFSSSLPWIYPLFELEDFAKRKGLPLHEISLHDRVGGLASVLLMAYWKTPSVRIDLLSRRALPLLSMYHIEHSYSILVDRLHCVTEELLSPSASPQKTYSLLRRRAGWLEGESLHLEDVAVNYGAKKVLSRCSLSLGPGEKIVIQGDNGSGKTTLFHALLGEVPHHEGSITLGEASPGKRRKNIGYIAQNTPTLRFPLAAIEVVAIGVACARLSGKEKTARVDSALRGVRALPLASRDYRDLSGGEKQRIALARCLCQRARLILMDEPTSFLDRESRTELISLLKGSTRGATVIIATHDESFAHALPWPRYTLKEGRLC